MENKVVTIPNISQEPAQEESRAPTDSKKGKSKKRGKNSSNAHQDAFRVKVGEKAVQEHRQKVFHKTFGDADLGPLPVARDLEIAPTRLTAQISASTRGIGFAVAEAYGQLVRMFPEKVPRMCTIFEAYRACLLQAYVKQVRAADERPKVSLQRVAADDLVLSEELTKLVGGYSQTFGTVANVVSGFGWFEQDGCTFWPYLKTRRTVNHSLVPSAFGVRADILREVVEAMESRRRPAAREEFVNLNPLPGARYNDNFELLNANEVCPANWPDRDSARRDLLAFQTLLNFILSKNLKTVRSCDFSGKGSLIALVSRRARLGERINADANGRISVSFPAATALYGTRLVSEQDVVRGGIALIGEAAVPTGYRDETSAVWTVDMDWLFLNDTILNQTLR